MSVVLRVSIPSRTSALEELAVGGAEGVGTGRQAYSRLMDDKRVIYYHELPTGTPRHRQRHYHLLAFLSLRRSSFVFFFLPPTVPFPSAARWRLFKLPFPPPNSLPPRHSSLVPVVPVLRALFEGRSISIMAPTPIDFSHALSALYIRRPGNSRARRPHVRK